MTTLSLRTEHASLDELEAAFAPRVGDGVVFLPAPCDAPVGERVSVDVTLESGEVALSFAGLVSWRYPAAAVPPGREAGVGVVVQRASEEQRARLERMRERAGAGERARAPGARLMPLAREPRGLREARIAAPDEEAPAVVEHAEDVGYERFEARTVDEVVDDYRRRAAVREATVREAREGEASVRPLPSPPPPDGTSPPRPALTGAFFVYEYDEKRRNVGVKHVEPFEWPTVGTQRPSQSDSRFRPPGDVDEDGPAPWDEITDGQRSAPRWEVSDPGTLVTDAVSRALDDMADVDGALRDSPRAVPARGDDDDGASAGALATGLRLRVDDGKPEPLFPAGSAVPGSRTVSLSPSDGSASVKVAVFEGDHEGQGRHLGTVRVQVPKGEDATSVRFDLRADGFLEVRSLDDGSVAELWRTSWAGPADYPRAEKRRGWRRWFRW